MKWSSLYKKVSKFTSKSFLVTALVACTLKLFTTQALSLPFLGKVSIDWSTNPNPQAYYPKEIIATKKLHSTGCFKAGMDVPANWLMFLWS